jgi:hypothetical protein
MGEYFDHAYYGIAHTKEGMRRKIPVLASNPASKLSYDDKEVPIFIVGNGPSLDSSIEAIKEWQGQAIVVSCGTTLQALHRHGITPDFHAEIEQNRSTFDWAVLIGDLDYLKNITLISCNGIHPDTCDLYKDVMIAFKEGESSTVSALNVLGRENFATLLNAFPTVSNFAIDLFSTIGFTSIYLIGVDLGFVDVKHHHSKSSGYYQEDGEETYDFTKSANTSLIVPGNFRPRVNTKHEFKVSRQVIEQVTSAKPKGQEFYNCSDGAKISGTLPIRPDELLIVVTMQQKTQIVKKLKALVFSTKTLNGYAEKFENMFSQDLLIEELNAFETLLEKEVTSKEDVEYIINKQKEMLFTSYKNGKSLLFYYLYGTVNYSNAVLTKLSGNITAELSSINGSTNAIFEWVKTLKLLKRFINFARDYNYYDTSDFKAHIREELFFPEKTKGVSLLLVSQCEDFKNSAKWVLSNYFPQIKNINIIGELVDLESSPSFDYVIYHKYNKTNKITGLINTLMTTNSNDVSILQHEGISIYSIPETSTDKILNNLTSTTFWAIRACLTLQTPAFIIPKLITSDGSLFNEDSANVVPPNYSTYDFLHFLCVYHNNNVELMSSKTGTRGKVIFGDIKMKHLLLNVKAPEELAKLEKKHREVINGNP